MLACEPTAAAVRGDCENKKGDQTIAILSQENQIENSGPMSHGQSKSPENWYAAPLRKQFVLATIFLGLFLITDGSSTASQGWEGAPPCYVPVGLAIALLLCGGPKYVPLVFLSSIVAAVVNYHRPLFSWCGLPGATASYFGYIAAAVLLRRRWYIDQRLLGLRDVGRFVVTLLTAEIFGAIVGMLTLLADGYIQPSSAVRTAEEKALTPS